MFPYYVRYIALSRVKTGYFEKMLWKSFNVHVLWTFHICKKILLMLHAQMYTVLMYFFSY